ncbi:P-loop containing nucleoside triphosphate hydrolase protein, partial [Kalaharituber pfeilii]
MIFVDDCTEAQRIVSFLRGLLHPELQEDGAKLIKPFSASLSNQFREIAIEDFRQGDTRILVCTDAAGMGVDIPDVELVVQWDIKDFLTLSDLWQRLGRAGRDPNIQATAVVYAPSHFL